MCLAPPNIFLRTLCGVTTFCRFEHNSVCISSFAHFRFDQIVSPAFSRTLFRFCIHTFCGATQIAEQFRMVPTVNGSLRSSRTWRNVTLTIRTQCTYRIFLWIIYAWWAMLLCTWDLSHVYYGLYSANVNRKIKFRAAIYPLIIFQVQQNTSFTSELHLCL